MAFGITRKQLINWKRKVMAGEIAFLTHYWYDKRFPNYYTVTKVGCSEIVKLVEWGKRYDLKEEWIHHSEQYPHFDLLGEKQKEILICENLTDHLTKFDLLK